jgi:uncharacterized protein YpiB (UPF0302 family)
MDFKFFQISAQNPKVLPFSFAKECQLVAKTDRNSVFLGYEAHISDQLYIMVHYTSFYGF